jgi:hypothetical protein
MPQDGQRQQLPVVACMVPEAAKATARLRFAFNYFAAL